MGQYADALAKIAEMQADTTAKYAPPPEKPAKPSTPAGQGMHWEWSGTQWVATKNKK
jgi:hypothetical protein